MVRVALFSDLHLDSALWTPPTDLQADIVVLAGDLNVKARGLPWPDARAVFGCDHVLAVAGNHDIFGSSIDDGMDRLRTRLASQGVSLLERDEAIVHGVRFLGCTLWTDVRLFAGADDRLVRADAAMLVGDAYSPHMRDYRQIRVAGGGYRRLRPLDTATLHCQSVEWLEGRLAAPHNGPTVVVTHHAPSARCLPAWAQQDRWSCAYASHLDWLVERYQPHAWCYGHIHDPPPNLAIGRTPLWANPRGHGDSIHDHNPSFDPYGLQQEF
ncbi:metallophosphoesterase [Nitrospirillum amazonense]|uniref:metallophosphoesterase n=1 Tax=Nitrospirillum amazonense TaxID=28077 RepID=UPI0024129872|nr:metallophosphoesterase [Nitrospirillum amazonense]MDG3439565.1 metallophosphoesterase [Nitrospirillum amazonense]